MAALHSALQALAPVDFDSVPTTSPELDQYVADLFTNAEAIVESIPLAPADASSSSARSSTASRASEMTTSSARGEPPAEEYVALQKEWGKPLKLSQKENAMGVSVYKVGGKDGRGAWFARRSVHAGLGFARFKRGFEKEFPASLAVQGAPGEGNIRGIGAETRVEEIDVPNRGHIDVYRLTAQFPGPTTPRDFVTFLVTSSKAMKQEGKATENSELRPRHYMIISKPCNHPDTQPRDGFVRGQYESIEFIREIPQQLKNQKKVNTFPLNEQPSEHGEKQRSDSQGPSRKRSQTVNLPNSPDKTTHDTDYDPEENPVEWIMITRSDPGGSVPRFMVDRGTPASICADAVKFLDWACQGDSENDTSEPTKRPPPAEHRESFSRLEANGRLTGIRDNEDTAHQNSMDDDSRDTISQTSASNNPIMTPASPQTPASSGIFASMAGAVGAYTPQVILDKLPGANAAQGAGSAQAPESTLEREIRPNNEGGDAASIASATSFASADSHFTSSSDEGPSISSQSPDAKLASKNEKSLAKLSQNKANLDAKYAAQKAKIEADASKEAEAKQAALRKIEEKHAKEVKKHDDRYERELAKIEARKEKEAKKAEHNKKKQADKDEKTKLTRERDEARAELAKLKKEQELMVKQIGDLQKENTNLAARLGSIDDVNAGGSTRSASSSVSDVKHGQGRTRGTTISELKEGNFFGRSRSPSLKDKKNQKDKDKTPAHSPESTRE